MASLVSSLAGKKVLIAGGVGTIGRGLARSLLQSGAIVVVNSRSQRKLDQLYEDLGRPERLIMINGTMMPSGVEETMNEVYKRADSIDHVVAHCGVRWWSRDSDETNITSLPSAATSSITSLGLEEFQVQTRMLVDMHWGVAAQTLPMMAGRPGTSFTFVTGGTNIRSSALQTMNTQMVWGLAEVLRSEAAAKAANMRGDCVHGVRVDEVRIQMKVDRDPKERAAEPRARPLSSDIGDVVAGLVSAGAKAACAETGVLHHIASAEEMKMKKLQYPTVVSPEDEIPVLWHWEKSKLMTPDSLALGK
mmetsp:Transcript_23685/g.49032  ORF Transcript_23685/g.49032 Transcript_23685/m.49032 type:complete len:305 (-) Transcript_23685:436-1350(-)|eukprot:CAMPEP_0182538192 /NCGR_PEP_ID=MMETSP1323-20130603/23317_1 /TAXON_ID=236787 /ORGANISM="Florenciella parvula, Strain RCC1693" /LENGTH=304 /DNA_ID=CAMNT_0024748645 /DNA_START=37 /DNA_END=951 /DNA_ORIENTATION=-